MTEEEEKNIFATENEVPENTTEYLEKLLLENIRSIKYAEKENIPEDIKSARLQYLEKQHRIILDRIEKLKIEDVPLPSPSATASDS